jgi:hypothetical protein
MSKDQTPIDPHTTAWSIQVWISFAVSLCLTVGGIALVPADWWVKGYLLMGLMFTVGSTFTLSKTVRDSHETRRLRNRMQAAKTDKILREFELSEAS